MNFCVMDKHCTVYDADTGMSGLARFNPLCQGCDDALKATLNKLRLDYVDLTQLLPPADARNEVGKIFRPKPESKPNMNLSAFALRGEIAYTIQQIANLIRSGNAVTPRTSAMPVREGFGLDCDLRYLEPRTEDIARIRQAALWRHGVDEQIVMDGPEIIFTLCNLHARAQRMCGARPKVLNLPGSCPFCRLSTFRRHDDDENNIWCGQCRRKFTAAEYGRAVRLQWPMRNPTE